MYTVKDQRGNTSYKLGDLTLEFTGASIGGGEMRWVHGTVDVRVVSQCRDAYASVTVGGYLTGDEQDGEWSLAQEGARVMSAIFGGDDALYQLAFPDECETLGREAVDMLRIAWSEDTWDERFAALEVAYAHMLGAVGESPRDYGVYLDDCMNPVYGPLGEARYGEVLCTEMDLLNGSNAPESDWSDDDYADVAHAMAQGDADCGKLDL